MKDKIIKILGKEEFIKFSNLAKYKSIHPYHFFLPSVGLYINDNLVWTGDIDFTLDAPKLISFSMKEKVSLYFYGAGEYEAKVDPVIKISSKGIFLRDEETNFFFIKDNQVFRKNETEENLPKNDDMHYQKDLYQEFNFPQLKLTDKNPYDEFYDSLSEQYGQVLDGSSIIMNSKLHEELLSLYKIWLKKNKKLKLYELNHSLKVVRQQVAPLCFAGSQYGPNWTKKDKVYIKERNK